MHLFESAKIGSCILKNRILRSATFEGMCDFQGQPMQDYVHLYEQLAFGGVGGIITGFAYISPEGKAIHPGQAGMDREERIKEFLPVTEAVHRYGSKIFMQLAHTGRQTRKEESGHEVWGVSHKRSMYFGGTPRELTTEQVYSLVKQFGKAARIAKGAGFDGVQVHAAHGYLIHQFILPSINKRTDEFGLDKTWGIGTKFLELVLEEIRETCGQDFVLLIKISGSDDYDPPFTTEQFKSLIEFLDHQRVDAIEISHGTMDHPLNIFRGDIPLKMILKHNPIFKRTHEISQIRGLPSKILLYGRMRIRLKPFTPTYNLHYAKIAKALTDIPIISVGGFRKGSEMHDCLENSLADFVSLSRPLICEPDFVQKLQKDMNYTSQCVNCNICAIMCDSDQPTRCYQRKERRM